MSAAGLGLDALVRALRDGRGCGRPLDTPLPVPAAAVVPDSVPTHADFPDDRKAHLAFAALALALEDGAWELDAEISTAVFLGTGLSSVTPWELEEDVYPFRDGDRFDRRAMGHDLAPDHAAPRRHMPGRVTAEVARRVCATGPVATSFSACAASAQAIAEGFRCIRRGEADRAVVGGHDSMVHPLGILSFVVLGALSPLACRPFDRRRDGFLIGEGAAVLLLERADFARERGARVRARLLGAATSVDAWAATAPHPDGAGAERVMRRALADAGVAPAQVDYVNAHGTGTPVGDAAEAKAIHRVLGRARTSSIKGAIGHTIAAAGAIETAACVAALERGFLPGTHGLAEPDPDCPIDVLAEPVAATPRVILSNSFGFGGQNAALVLAQPGFQA